MASSDLQEHTAVFFRVFKHLDKYKVLMCTDLTRSSTKEALTDALDDMVARELIAPELALRVVDQFDKSIVHALEHQVNNRVTFKGHLLSYRYCDHVWTFVLTDATFKNEKIGRVKIVACNSELFKPQGQ